MVLVGSNLNVIDNSGVKRVKCLKILGVNRRKYAKVGDVIIVSHKRGSTTEKKKFEKGKISKAVVVRVKSPVQRLGGEVVFCNDNAVVLLKGDDSPQASRVTGAVMGELRTRKYMKVVSLALICI